MNLAEWLGQFIGSVLAECAPVLVEILSHAIREGLGDTVEDGAVRDDLRQRLLSRLRQSNSGTAGTTRPPAGNDP
ncbi:MAG: hypothetical protein ACREJ2_03185 [Planctomycetota bacterium]